MRNRSVAGLTAFIAAAALTGCGGGGSAGKAAAPGGTGAAAGNAITIKSFKFMPESLQASVGKPITVTNEDSAVHTLTAKDKSFDSKDLAQGKTFTFTPSKAGTFEFVCSIHQYMTGTLVVS